jgi:thiamine-phosphate pyrophosphorylase
MICLVTDRRRLVADAAGSAIWRDCLIRQIEHAVAAGIDLVQVRERDLEAGALAALVADLLMVTKGTATRLVVNDRIDVALACGADGVHLRSDSIPTRSARRLAPGGFLIGRSVHGVEEATAAAGADYLVAGTLFRSASKPGGPALLGIEGLRTIVRAVDCPVLAIGGVAGDGIDEVAAAGAAGFAAIGLFMAPSDAANPRGCRAIDLRQEVQDARARFDRL